MPKPTVEIKKSYVFGLFAVLLWAPLPWIYFNPPQFLQGQPLTFYAIVLFLAGMSSAALAVFFFLNHKVSSTTARIYSTLFLFAGIGIYQLSGFAPNWSCFGKQIYAATANAAGQNCTSKCVDNDKKPCDGWSSCWDKFVSCNSAGRDQDGRGCNGCCFACEVVCEPEPDPDQPPSISASITCSQTGNNGWCIGTGVLNLTASDPQSYTLTITGSIGGTPFTCPVGNACFRPIPQGAGTINYTVTAAQSGLSKSGSTTWKVDATPPSINGTLTGAAGANGWYLGSVTYNGSASDPLSGLASFTCTLDGVPLGSCNSIAVNNEGAHTLALTARDNAGNTQVFNQTISIDLQNPTLNSGISGTLGSNNWYTDATLNASASDAAPGSGIWGLEYSLDGGNWAGLPASGSLDLPQGQHTVEIRAVDLAGRVTTGTKPYALDRELPNIAVTPTGTFGLQNWYITSLTVSATASDNTSGLDVFEYSLSNGAWTPYSSPLTLNDGTHRLSFWAQDVAGLVKQVDETYQVDTRPPQISGNLSGVPGTNGWYISQVAISASAADPAPGSGVETLTYILNDGAETPYTSPLTVADGQHTVQFNAQDVAGLTDSMTQIIKVDTIKPSLNITTTLPAWNMGMITINGTASDSGSGLSRVELSTDGITWQAVNGTTAWSYDWDTTKGRSGSYQVRVRATDHAGLTTEGILSVGVDNHGPKIHLPEEWFQWDIVTLDVWDNHSGLSEVRVEIIDPEGRWKTRKIQLDPNDFPLDFKWDRRFGDGTVAPLGTYPVKVLAFDKMGNMTRVGGTAKILLGILPPGPTATSQPYMRLDLTPTSPPTLVPFAPATATSMPFISGFGSTPEPSAYATPTIPASPRAAPTKTTIMDWIESIFVPSITEETITDVSSPQADPNIFWGATLAAVAGAVAAYNLEEQRKREKKAAREADEERRSKQKAQKLKKLEAQWAQEKAWEDARQKEEQQKRQAASTARMDAKMDRLDAEDDAKWTASQAVIQKQEEKKKLEKQYAGLVPYRNSEWNSENDASDTQTNWWEKTKSFVQDKIIDPVNVSLMQPIIKPAWDTAVQNANKAIEAVDEKIVQPHLKPFVEARIQEAKDFVEVVNEKVYQPYVKPHIDAEIQKAKKTIEMANDRIIQPYIKPYVETKIQQAKEAFQLVNEKVIQPYIVPAVTTINEKVYQPHVKPLLDKSAESLTTYTQWMDEKLYQPIFAPVVNDINDVWNKYGEWVHGALDTVGFIPGLGEIADGLNGVIYLAEGRYIEASVSLLAMVPVVGDLGKAGKWTVKIGQEIVEEGVEKLIKEGAEELLEKAVKETGEEVGEALVEKAAKETSEELVEKVTKETLEEAAEKTTKEAGEELIETVAKDAVEKTTKEVTSEAVTKVAKGTISAAPPVLAKEVPESVAKETVEETLEQESMRIAQLISSITEDNHTRALEIIHAYGDEGIALLERYGDDAIEFVNLAEKRGINPIDVLYEPPTQGQTLEGWMLKIDNPENPVNMPLKLNQTHEEIVQLRKDSIQNADSKLFSIGYGRDAKIPFDKMGNHFKGHPMAFVSVPAEKWARFEETGAYGDFWEVNRDIIEWGVEERKIFVLNVPYDVVTDVDPKYSRRFSLAEVKQIKIPTNDYTVKKHGEYAVLVPNELIDTYSDFLPAEIRLS